MNKITDTSRRGGLRTATQRYRRERRRAVFLLTSRLGYIAFSSSFPQAIGISSTHLCAGVHLYSLSAQLFLKPPERREIEYERRFLIFRCLACHFKDALLLCFLIFAKSSTSCCTDKIFSRPQSVSIFRPIHLFTQTCNHGHSKGTMSSCA